MNSKVKKALPTIISVLLVVGALIATVGAAVTASGASVNFNEGIKEGGIGAWKAAFALAVIAMVAYLAVAVMKYADVKCSVYVEYLAIVCAIIAGLLFFLTKVTYCKEAANIVTSYKDLMKMLSLGVGAIFSGIFMFLSVIVAGYDVIKNK